MEAPDAPDPVTPGPDALTPELMPAPEPEPAVEPEPEPEPEPGPCTVFVGGVPGSADPAAFRAFMARHGPIAAFKLVVREGSRFGFAFVQYHEAGPADRVKANAFLQFMGRKLNVGDARRKPPPPAEAGGTPTAEAAPAASPGFRVSPPPPTTPAAPDDALVVEDFEAAVRSFVTFDPAAPAPPSPAALHHPQPEPSGATPGAPCASHLAITGGPDHHAAADASGTARPPAPPAPVSAAERAAARAPIEAADPRTARGPPDLIDRPAAPPPAKRPRAHAPPSHAPAPTSPAAAPAPPPPLPLMAAAAMPVSALDAEASQLAMAWFHTGYWTGYYAGRTRRAAAAAV